MATRKTPLADNPNAANSPHRNLLGGKRGRPSTFDADSASPPKKRSHIHISDANYRQPAPVVAEEPKCGVFAGKPPTTQPTIFQKKLVVARDTRQKAQHVQDDKQSKQSSADKASQNWRNHYWKIFPSYVLYFDGLSDEAGSRAARCIRSLGARQEKFFSKEVTHIVTTRTVSSEPKARESRSAGVHPVIANPLSRAETIDPSILHSIAENSARGKSTSNAASQKRSQMCSADVRQQPPTDILQKASEMGIKVWTHEKFERVISELLSADSAAQVKQTSRANSTMLDFQARRVRNTDLSQLLRDEKNNNPGERKPWHEIAAFRGYYIYVHDMDEKVRPIMVRDYARTTENKEGEWPQFRAVSKGRCPFVEEPEHIRRDEKEKRKEAKQTVRKAVAQVIEPQIEVDPIWHAIRESPADSFREVPKTRNGTRGPQKRALQESHHESSHMAKPRIPASLVKAFDPPALQTQPNAGIIDMPQMLGSAQANFRGVGCNPGGEPLASGIQQNITSAIRSQMFSSTAPSAPGPRAGLSKQQHQMSRRVLERQSGFSANSIPSSLNTNDVRAAINNDQTASHHRNTRRRAAQKMAQIHEDETLSEDDDKDIAAKGDTMDALRVRGATMREAKPGYCENCRDKYSDFHEHVVSKKHRKFASCDDNFRELDALLEVLKRQ